MRAGAAAETGPSGPKAGLRLDPSIREAARREPVWQAEAFPVLVQFEEPGSPRPVMVLVTAGEVVLGVEAKGRLGGTGEAVAEALEAAVSAAARGAGVWPRGVQVRHAEVAEALRARLKSRDVSVAAVDPLPTLEDAARSLMDNVVGHVLWPPISRSTLWAGWDLPRARIAELFAAAAEYWRAAPWRTAANLQAPRAVLSSGRAWTSLVLGNAGEEFGLSLYSDDEDAFRVAMSAPDTEPFHGVRGRIITLGFTPVAEMPEDARREARVARWEIAAPRAFPMLTTVNTPGGGITEDDVDDLVLLLRAVPAFVEEHRFALLREQQTGRPGPRIDWLHEETGVRFRYDSEAFAEDAEALGRHLSKRVQTYNEAPQSELGGLSPLQVQRLLDSRDWSDARSAVRLRRDLPIAQLQQSDILFNVRTLLANAIEHDGLAMTDAGNLKLAVVADLLDRIRMDAELLASIRSISKRITESDIWPLHLARILAELSGALGRKGRRFVAGAEPLIDDDEAGELFARLFETCFLRFNLGYFGFVEWPELQHQIAFTLYRLGSVATDWTTARAILDDAVLPYARERGPETEVFHMATASLESHVLDRLVDFGLLESRGRNWRTSPRESRYRITKLFADFVAFDV